MIETEFEIKMPGFIDSSFHDIIYLIDLFNGITKSGKKKVYLNYQNTRFFASELYGLYHYLIDEARKKGIEVYGINANSKVDYVMSLNEENKSKVPKYQTLIQYKDFKEDLDLGNIDCFDDYLAKEFLPKIVKNANVISVITSYLSELFVNARTHGNTHNIRCSGQIYKNGSKLKFIIVDFGVTIPYNIANHLIKDKFDYYHENDGAAIKWATIEGNTTKEKLGGLGLNDISEFIKKYNGKIEIFSRFGYYEINPKNTRMYKLKNKFNGTLILVELDLEKIGEMQLFAKATRKFEI